MRYYVLPNFPGYTEEAISVNGSDDDDSSNADIYATYDELTTKVPTQAFMWPSSYASWTDVTTAVHALALSVNKQVSIVAKLSNSKRKVYRCSHWIAANKKHFKLVRFVLCYILLPLHTYMCIINDIVVASRLHVGISCGCCTGAGPGRKRIPE